MSLSEMLVRLVGIIFIIVGAGLLLSVVGLNVFGLHVAPMWLSIVLGICFLAAGIALIRGGSISL